MSMAAGARRRLASFFWTAIAARQESFSSLPPPLQCVTAPATRRSLASLWSEHCCHSPASLPFLLGLVHRGSHHEPALSLELARSANHTGSEIPFASSIWTTQSLASSDIGLLSVLCVSDGKANKQSSTQGDSCTSTGSNDSSANQSFWSSKEIVNWPNAISLGRLLSGPLLGWLIMKGMLQPAVVGLVIAGASDWFDGYIARRQGIDSVFGTYLDPLADKVLIGCVVFSMGQAGYLPWALVALVIARDAALVCGSLMLRAQSLNTRVTPQDIVNFTKGRAQKIEPLYISKINTVIQLSLVAVALFQPAFGIEDSYALVPLLSWCVICTTCASFAGYGWKLLQKR